MPTEEGRGTGAEIGENGIRHVREVVGRTCGGGDTVRIPRANPGPNRQ